MIKRELAKDPKLANEDWSRFLPKFTKRKQAKKSASTAATGANAVTSTSTHIFAGVANGEVQASSSSTPFPPLAQAKPKKEKKVYTPFPPAQTPRKIDLQMASGEYFLKPHEKKRKEVEERTENQKIATEERKKKRAEQFIAPSEDVPSRKIETESSVAVDGEPKAKKRKRNEDGSSGLKKSKTKKSAGIDAADD